MVPVLCASLLVLLFGYSGLQKIADNGALRYVLQQVQMIKQGAVPISILLPWGELVVALLLLFPRTRPAGLRLSLALLILFSAFIVFMMTTIPHLPCACGGVLNALGWKGHLVFNIFFAGIAYAGIRYQRTADHSLATGPPTADQQGPTQ
jgi:uncharacterized membrane protein YphA (DoxX/SURF4 family)